MSSPASGDTRRERSQASHAHYFAALAERWRALPIELRERYPTVDALRHLALIRTGYFVEHEITVDRGRGLVIQLLAQSQSRGAMGRDEFQRSKDAVLDYIDSEILRHDP